jgi:hypothetical protein
MSYDPDKLEEMRELISLIPSKQYALFSKITSFGENLTNVESKKFLFHGVLRRLKIISRCINNVFNILPPDREEKLS